MNDETKNIIAKVRKLLALSTSDNEHEAALAAAKAQQLLSEHNLNMSDCEETIKAAGATRKAARTRQVLPVWAYALAEHVSKAFDCDYFHSPGYGYTFFVGVGADPEVAGFTYAHLYQTILRLATRYLKEPQNRRLRAPGQKKARAAYSLGAVESINVRLVTQKRETPITPGALVPVKKELVAREMEKINPTVKAIPPATPDPRHYIRGRIDGQHVAIVKGIAA